MTINRYRTSDIKIHKDSQGCYECTHRYQGTLIDFNFYDSRAEARRAAVEVLMEMKD